MHQQCTPADRKHDRPFHQTNRPYRGQRQRGQRCRLTPGAQSISDAPRSTFDPADDTRYSRACDRTRRRARGVRRTGDNSPGDARRTGDGPRRDVRRTGEGAPRTFLDVHANSLAPHRSE